jgi:hypothetical protein
MFKYIQYEYPVEFTINHVMVWASASLNAYVGYSRDGITWNYLKAQASHALSSGSLLEASNEADAQENYWTTGISGDGQLADALWPYMRQAKICRLYFSTTPVTIHELKFWVYVIADEIVAGTLRLATGLIIASTQDPNNAVIMDSSGIRAYSGSVQKLNITPAGITITAGSGYANLSDKPTSLSGINSGEGTKLSGIAAGADVTSQNTAAGIAGQGSLATQNAADFASQISGAQKPANNATVGADWNTNLVNIPGTLVSPSGDGLYLGATYMGFYKSSAWKSFMKNDGTFQFYGDASNYVAWNGSTLSIKGSIAITGGSGYANISDKPSSLSGINSGEGTKLSGIAAGADVTSQNTAAAISGQGALATKSNVAASDCDTTIISGGKIITGLLTASNIQTGTLNLSLITFSNSTLASIDSAASSKLAGISAGADVTLAALDGGLQVTGGGINLAGTGSKIRSGQTAFNTGTGFWLGNVSSTPKFSIGNPSGKYLTWDGSDLTVGGDIIATGNIVNQAVTRGAEYINNSAITFTGTETEIGSITITTNTASDYVWLWARAFTIVSPIYNDGKDGVAVGSIYRIRRNSTAGPIVDQWTFPPWFITLDAPCTLMGISQPGAAGAIVFKLTAQASYSPLTRDGQAAYRLLMGLSKSK